jgi:3-phosphoshikimate 1-carboxyvinyltransferase
MIVTIKPTILSGEITPPPSKSYLHRGIIAAALSGGESVLRNIAYSQDILASLDAMKALGADFTPDGNTLTVVGAHGAPIVRPDIDCRESGSTLRFAIPVALALCGGGRFTGHGRLMERPLDPYFRIFDQFGIRYGQEDGVLTVEGTLTSGRYELPGNVSSQFISGLLFALTLLRGDSQIVVTSKLESGAYVDMTLDTLEQFGIRVETDDHIAFYIRGGQKYRAAHYLMESDYSQAAFYFAANALGSRIGIRGLSDKSSQGDMAIRRIAHSLQSSRDVTIDVGQIPDLVPAVAVIAALRDGRNTTIFNASRLRLKECDRLDAMTAELGRLGACIRQTPDSLEISGVKTRRGGEVESRNDHRIAMALAVAATRADSEVTIRDAECVSKSYPNFWEVYQRLGGLLI